MPNDICLDELARAYRDQRHRARHSSQLLHPLFYGSTARSRTTSEATIFAACCVARPIRTVSPLTSAKSWRIPSSEKCRDMTSKPRD